MKLRVETKAYTRRFLQPLSTAHGPWQWRKGILIRVMNAAGAVGYGEVCPLPWFGTETLEMAQHFWQGRADWLPFEELCAVPDGLPATQFAIAAALGELEQTKTGVTQAPAFLNQADVCGLLPAGEEALNRAIDKLKQGYRTLKWKIGVFPMEQEIAWLWKLMGKLEHKCQIRLDANGGLTRLEAELWLKTCDDVNSALNRSQENVGSDSFSLPYAQNSFLAIEFLEQPLPPDRFKTMLKLSQKFQTPIALDESIASLAQFSQHNLYDWPGIVVIKPAVAGSPPRLKQFLGHWGKRVVFSSAFETTVGRQAALRFALNYYRQAFSAKKFPALGFDTLGYFKDDWDRLEPEQLWAHI